ncbi:MAG: AAA family ATPase [Caldilinea sp. CFX5]|nr:AAA family ATPase [Caldilinea sp. CFX5]
MKFPYGISDFYQIIDEGYFYLDRTMHIRLIEETGKTILFLRPRRFGKSLLLSMLENYYDIAKAGHYDHLFSRLAIGQKPTPLYNRYLIMRWDFSTVATYGTVDQIQRALTNHVNNAIKLFASRYQHYLAHSIEIAPDDPIASFQSVMAAVQQSDYKVYLLIDEYDNFANEILMAHRTEGLRRYEDLVKSEGMFRSLFKAVKAATSGQGLDRIFITGVSPIVLSDVSSGFNIAGNIYLWPNFNDVCGFSEAEIADTLRTVIQERGMPEAKATEALAMMRAFYNGYSFNYNLPPTIYNPTLAIYFLQYLQTFGVYPREMLDSNLAMDQVKIQYISHLPNGEALIQAALQEQPPIVVDQLADRFGVEALLQAAQDTTLMTSLLYFFGVLTLTNEMTEKGQIILRIPNMVARRLYAERMAALWLPDVTLREEGRRAAQALYQNGDMQPLSDFVEQHLFKVLDNRDYRWANELTVKATFLSLLFNDTFYLMDSEPALQRNYGDLLMLIRPEMRRFTLCDILVEFEYVSLSTLDLSGDALRQLTVDQGKALPAAQAKLQEARRQLQQYRTLLTTTYSNLRLRTYAVVALGFERVIWEEV